MTHPVVFAASATREHLIRVKLALGIQACVQQRRDASFSSDALATPMAAVSAAARPERAPDWRRARRLLSRESTSAMAGRTAQPVSSITELNFPRLSPSGV